MSVSVETDVLIVGTGPAGASLACFLASYGGKQSPAWLSNININTERVGIKGIMIGATSSTADGPRAHITNMAAMGQSVPLTLMDALRFT